MSPTRSDGKAWTWGEYAGLPEDGWSPNQVLDAAVFVSPPAGRTRESRKGELH